MKDRGSTGWPRLRSLLLLLSVLACACGASSSPSPRALVMADVRVALRDLRFPSGLRVIIEEDHRAPVVGVFTLVGSGSTSDPPGKEGLAHYVEHLAFRARPDGKTSIWSLIGRTGAGEWNATTGLDETLYYEVGPREALSALVLLEGVRMLGPTAQITPETAAVERDVVRNELRQRNETGFVGSTLGAMQKALFPPDHPYARPVIGTHESLTAMTLEDAQRFAAEHYRPDNITMIVVGDVDMQTVARTVEESLPPQLLVGSGARAPGSRLAPAAPAPPDAPPGAMARYQAALATPELWIGWTLPRAFDAEGYLDQFVATSAGGHLPRAFWDDTDIAGVTVHLVRGKEAAMLLCRVALRDASHPERSADHILNKLIGMWGYRANDVGFVRQQRSAITALVLGAENLVTRGQERAELTHFTGDPAAYARSLRSVMSVDAGRVAQFAYKYVTRDRARTVLFTPLSPGASPPPDEESAAPAPLDEPPTSFDAASIKAFIHAPGVGAYRRFVLANGLEVILGRRPGLPVVTVGLSLHGGSGAASPPGADEMMRRLGRRKVTSRVLPSDFGGHLEDAYGRDALTYSFRGASGNVGNMLELLADWAPNMRVDSGASWGFDRDVIPFLQKSETQPEAQASRAFWHALYGKHPYGRSVLAGDLVQLGPGDANQWLERVAVARNAVLAIVGDIDLDATQTLVRDSFGRWSPGEAPAPPPPPPALPEARAPRPSFLVTHRPGATQGQLSLGCLLPPAGGSRARYSVLASLLGERVLDTVRHRLGASYGISAGATTLRGGAAHLGLQGAVDNAHLGKALEVVKKSLEALEQGRFAPGELEAARWRVARGYGVRYLTNASIVSAILAARNQDRDLGSIDAFPADLAAVTGEELKADFARCNAAPVLSLVGDEPTIRAALAEVWP